MNPEYGFLEITSHCNFKCTFCPSEMLKRKKGNLDVALAKKFIEEFASLWPGTPLQLNILGEPLINKDIFTYLDLCKEYNVWAILITNYSLLSDELAEKLFSSYHNFSLVLSLQTPNEKSFEMRRCNNYKFEDYYHRVEEIIELKVKNKCRCNLEIHVASTYVMTENDPTIMSDIDFDPFRVFEDESEMKMWHMQYVNYLEDIKKRLSSQYASEYVYLETDADERFKDQICNGEIIASKDKVPSDMYNMTENELWGYMCMPAVFLRYKTFGLWTKDLRFLKTLCEKENVFVYVAERVGKMDCSMASNIGILSNGDIVSCCLDYEGDMQLGNIEKTDLGDNNLANKLEEINQNVLTQAVCRRCKGDVIIASKEPIQDNEQKVTFFGLDWFPFEKEMNGGRGGRWSKASSTAYVYTRINHSHLEIFLTSMKSDEPAYIKIYSFDLERNKFIEEYVHAVLLEGGEKKVLVPFAFGGVAFYKIEFHTTTFCPCNKIENSSDGRNLGICLFDMRLVKQIEDGVKD